MNKRIKLIRKTLNISQGKFGEKLGVTKTAISRMELGKYNVTRTIIILICQTYNVSEEWLRTGKGEMFNTTDDLVELLSCTVNTLNEEEQNFLMNFLSMNEKDRHETLKYLRKLIGK